MNQGQWFPAVIFLSWSSIALYFTYRSVFTLELVNVKYVMPASRYIFFGDFLNRCVQVLLWRFWGGFLSSAVSLPPLMKAGPCSWLWLLVALSLVPSLDTDHPAVTPCGIAALLVPPPALSRSTPLGFSKPLHCWHYAVWGILLFILKFLN